jgi:hypothetical protein
MRGSAFVGPSLVALPVVAGLVFWPAVVAPAQPPTLKSRPKPAPAADVKRLDAQMEKVREAFLRETNQLIESYEEVGQYDRARFLLDALHKLDPADESIRGRLDALAEKILETSSYELDIDPGKSWQPVGRLVKDQAFRVAVTGESRFVITATAGPAGLAEGNPAEDLVSGVPLGAVMGVVAPPGGGRGGGDKQPKPFAVGAAAERKADRDGVLYLKINAPPGSKITGKFTVTVAGATPLE